MTERGRTPGIGAEELELILEVTRRLAAPFDLPTMLTQVIDAGRAVLRAERGTVYLYDPRTDELFVSAATGMEPVRFRADRGIAGECARTRAVVNVPDCYADPRFNPEVDRKTGYRTRCLLTVPLIAYDDSLVGVLQMLNKEGGVFTEADERVATALAAQCAVALQRVRMLADLVAKERMERELAVARDVQMRVLPKVMPGVAGYDLAGFSRPADQTGGDVYDVIAVDERQIMLLLGDATGHGIGPALSVTQMRAMLRMAMRLGADLDAAFGQINDQLCADLADNRFVTAFLGVLDSVAHQVSYHSGGQGPLLHFHAETGACEWAGSTTLPLGTIAGLKLKTPYLRPLATGDILALITDGIYEYANPRSDLFGQERVGEIVLAHQGEPMTRLIEIIVSEAERFSEGAPQGDDLTLLLVKRLR